MFDNLESGKIDLHKLRSESAYHVSWPVYLRDRLIGINTRASHAWILRHCTQVLAAQSLPPKQRLAKLQELDQQAVDAPEPTRTFAAVRYGQSYRINLRYETRIRCAAVGLAAEQFRLKHERWPKNMNELVAAHLSKVQIDPYSGEPIEMRMTPDGMVIYSPGPDGVWQGDAREDRSLASDDARFDHEFRLWNLSKRRR